jgi:hypothetical protein
LSNELTQITDANDFRMIHFIIKQQLFSREILLFKCPSKINCTETRLRIKRDNNSNNITDKSDVSHYVVSSIVSLLAILKIVTTIIGQKWQRNKIDHKLKNSQFRIGTKYFENLGLGHYFV